MAGFVVYEIVTRAAEELASALLVFFSAVQESDGVSLVIARV